MTPKAVRAHWTTRLPKDACPEAVRWCKTQPSLAVAWKRCERGDWMLWFAGRLSGEPESDARRHLVLAACECARLTLPIFEAERPRDDRPRRAIEMAERWARGGDGAPSLAEVRRAADAAYAAADAAYAAAYAAFAAAYAAYAAYAAAYAAVYAAAADAAAYAADAAERTCADIVRRHYPRAPALPRSGR